MKRVLIVDDSSLILTQLEDALTSIGYEVVGRATSGQEAVQQAKRLRPDVVLMDIVMPGEIDGIEAAREIVEKLEIPVIFLTGHDEEDLIERAGNVDANGFILKPFRHTELKATIEIALKKKAAEKRQKTLYKDLVESTYDLIYVLDGRGNIRFVNNTAAKTLGYSFEEIAGRNIKDFTTPESYRFLELMFERQLKREDIGTFEIHLYDKDRNVRVFEAREQLNWDGDRITELFGIARDVTERRRGEKQRALLSALKEYLLGSYKFTEKLRNITDKIVEIFNADFARIWIIKPGDLCDFDCYHADVTEGPHVCRDRDRCLHLQVSSGRYTHTDGEIHHRVPFDCYKIGKVASGLYPKFITNDVTHDPLVHDHTWAEGLGLVSFAGYRLLSAAGDPIGVMALFSKQAISPEEDELLEDLANTTAQVIQMARAEETLRGSEERYRALYEDNPSMYFTVNEEGTVLSVNPYGAEQLGYTVDELIAQPVLQVFHEEDRDPVTEQLKACLKNPGQVARWEFRKIRKDGSMLWVREAARAVRQADGMLVVFIVCEDITDQKQAEEELRKSEQRYRLLAENVNDIIFTADMDFTFTYVSPSVTRIRGFTVEEAMDQTPAEILTPGSLEVLMNAYREELALEARGTSDPMRTRTLELEQYCKDGSTIYTETAFSGLRDDDGKLTGFIGITRDVTERKKAEKALRESEAKFRSVFETSRDFMYLSSLDGKIIDYNMSAKEFFGYSDGELRDMTILNIYHNPEDRVKLVEKLKAEGFVENYELKLKKKDGSLIDALATITVRRDGNGNVIGFQGSVKDITQMRRLEQQLIQVEKLSGLGTMISGVAHELNNPLTAIMGNAEFMLMDKTLPEKVIRSSKVIFKESEGAAKIISGLLTFAREHKQERRMISINDIIMESYMLREYNLKVSNIDVRLSLADNLPPTYADPYQLQQVFTNIINNARDALRDKGGGALTIRSARERRTLIVEFDDDGPGIEKENIKKIFDPFFTTKDIGKGTGLGLSMAYGIINEHGGRIDVESEPGRGAKFIVSIPVVSSRREEKKLAAEKKTDQTGKRILVIDDEEYIRDLLSDVLSEKGHIVTTSSSGQEALTLIGKESFDAILLDIKMPGMEGKELYAHIYNSYPEMAKRIVFITGDTLSGETQAFLKVFENRYIAKPFRIEALYRVLNQVLEQ